MKMFVKQHKLILIIDIVLLVIYAIITFAAHNMAASLYSQQEAARWENADVKDAVSKNSDKKDSNKQDAAKNKKRKLSEIIGGKSLPYAQVSAFISPGHAFDSDGINGVRSALQEKLSKDSRAQSQTGGRVWIDAYSCETDISLRKDSNTLSATAVGVGGDFFQFHPMKLLSGSYISDEDLNHDRIVVDENFAWAMFGSNDIIGMQVWFGNNVYYVAGVVKVEEDDISQMAYGNSNRIYMSYSELKKQNDALPITCYEVVYPNPISNYAFYAVRSAFGLSDESEDQLEKKKDNPLSFDDVEVIENTKRYETMELLSKLKTWRLRSMRASSVGYPFWENVARVQDDTQMVLLLIRYALLICPIISAIWLIYGLWERRTWTFKALIKTKIENAVEERRAEKYYAKEREKLADDDVSAQSEDIDERVEDIEMSEEVESEEDGYVDDHMIEDDYEEEPEENDEEESLDESDTEVELVSVIDEDLLS